jgi:eukaryotic-like serine/threonine-protein kinase
MTLASGTKLGSYEITAPIGAGGMGEVYRARDAKLGRDVALKVLPEAFARDAERMARFQREAKVLASLNHPNIASIYGLEDSGSTHALVMELVEGPTLADRIKQGPIPIDEALRIAKQICEALEYAHERGIVHRDLKPANIKVTNDDAVKVLDFGLAKAIEGDPSSIDISSSPTMSRMATMQGVLLGTAPYMSPEQAKAKSVDRRADIWAFACVLYEMLTGKRAFDGETVTDTLAAVIKEEPDWSQLPAAKPARVRVLLQRCLQKDPKQRLRDIGDARISIDEVLSGASDPSSPAVAAAVPLDVPLWRRTLPWALGIFTAVVAGFAGWALRPSVSKPVVRAVITLPPGQQLAGMETGLVVALSPDGTYLAYVASQGGVQQIYLRAMDSGEVKAVPGTEGAVGPVFSQDGQWLSFFAGGKLEKIAVTGGEAQILADAPDNRGASWGSQGSIAFVPTIGPIEQVSDAGGSPQPLTHLEDGEFDHIWPTFLPNSKAVLFSLAANAIAVQPQGTGQRRTLIQGGVNSYYVSPGYLVYAQAGTLLAVPFDAERLEVTGTPVPVVQNVLNGGVGPAPFQYSVSASGSLVYVSGRAQQNGLVWVNRSGAEEPLKAPVEAYDYLELSPDGQRLAVSIGTHEVWLFDFARETLTPVTSGGAVTLDPVWSPDGKRIAFSSAKEGQLNMYWQMADGTGGVEQLRSSDHAELPSSWSPDGQLLAFTRLASGTGSDIWVLRLSDRKAEPFLQTPAQESAARFSPDGRWLAYVSDTSGRREVYVQPYPGPGGRWQISTDGGGQPVWSRNGRELFYQNGDKMMAVDVSTVPNFSAGKPKMLFEGLYASSSSWLSPFYDVSPDGQRFLMLKPAGQAATAPPQINLVLNWTEELQRLVPIEK